ncbi:MAG TPA: glycosyltransferase [Blastocatellia bacterium]|nr:glycosyltransferase [Blastocatellia bacterium]
MKTERPLTVGITTRNRLDSLIRCVASLGIISHLAHEIIVIDDCSDAPVEGPLRQSLPPDFSIPLTVIRHSQNDGPIVARNRVARLAKRNLILSLDDDAAILEPGAIERAVELISSDRMIGAVALAQADGPGRPWPELMQPSPVRYTCYVAAFIGFATVIRRDDFLSLGGYRSRFYYYGEEKEYCLRLLDSGRHVVYLPGALVGHFPDPSGRSMQKYLRHVIRNDCLGAIYNEPLPLLALSIPVRLCAYLKMKRHSKVKDPNGFIWIVGELLKLNVWKERRPLKWKTFRRWRDIKRSWPPYGLVDHGTQISQ